MGHEWTNLSYANVATTSAVAHKASRNWEDSLARGGAAEFDADAEKLGMMPLREAVQDSFPATYRMFSADPVPLL